MKKWNKKKAEVAGRKAAQYRAAAEANSLLGLVAMLSASSQDVNALKSDGRETEARGAMQFHISGAVELGSIPANTEEEAHLKLTILGAIIVPEPPHGGVHNTAAMIAAAIRYERARWRLTASDDRRH